MQEEDKDKKPTGERDVPKLGNRQLVGRIPVKTMDWVILTMSVVLIGLFIYLLLK